MNIDYRTVPHPVIKDRKITFVFVDNKIDLPSSRYLVHEATYGGRHGYIPGRQSHIGRANRIGELYRHLDEMGLNWRNATEPHIKMIRNAMLCWDANDNEDYDNYDYKKISNNSMNAKLGSWFKFYKHMEYLGEFYDMSMTTKEIIKPIHGNNQLAHLNLRFDSKREYIEVWILRIKPDPQSHTYHAISRTEYSHLERHFQDLDMVYVMLSNLMVETGLRATAALEFKEKDFKFLFRYLNSGRKMNDCIKVSYIAKGGDSKKCDLPIRTIARIQKEYLSREYVKRKKHYSNRCERLDKKYNNDILWITKQGKEVNYIDLSNAFIKVSEKMGRIDNRITAHWMRHTFATWTLMDYSNDHNIPLSNTGVIPDVRLLNLLMEKLGHATLSSTMKYIMTALRLMGVGANKGAIVSMSNFRLSKPVQELIKIEAKAEFGDDFKEDLFDNESYAISRRIVIDDSISEV
ncbi:MAG: hypothetical protein COA66_05975 [Arcobacter sp.]|nr:MAG: hypothetical protein COA66_05975 [Arcobacter sp.]